MNLQQMEYFRVIAETENITAAAEKLHITQPSLSYTIKTLENEIGGPLFERNGKSISLNSTGVNFLKNVNSILELINKTKREANKNENEWAEISIGAVGAETFIVPIVEKYLKSHKNVSFHFVSRTTLLNMINLNSVDFIIASEMKFHNNRQKMSIGTTNLVLIIPPGHPLYKRKEIDLSEMKDDDFISLIDPLSTESQIDSFCRQYGFDPKCIAQVEDRFIFLSLFMSKKYVAIIPDSDAITLKKLFKDFAIVRLKKTENSPKERIKYISWIDDYLSPAAKDFSRFLQEHKDEINVNKF